MWRSRAYAPIETRIERVRRSVHSRAELLEQLESAAQAGEPLHARLACDVELEGGITIPEEVPAFSLDGGGIYRLLYVDALPYVFHLESEDTTISLEGFAAHAGGVSGRVATSFLSARTIGRLVHMRNLAIADTTDLLNPLVSWTQGVVVDVSLNEDPTTIPIAYIRTTVGSLAYFSFLSMRGTFSVSPGGVGSTGLTFFDVGSPFNSGAFDSSAVAGAYATTAIGCHFSTVTLKSGDLYLSAGTSDTRSLASMGGATFAPVAVTLNSANPTLTPGAASMIHLSLGASSSGNIFLADGQDGQLLYIWIASLAGTAIIADSTASSNARLVGNWTPTLRGTLALHYVASDAAWQEISRAQVTP